MNDEKTPSGTGFGTGFLFGAVVGAIITALFALPFGGGIATANWKRDMVQRGHAEYNQTNGAWQWKQPK